MSILNKILEQFPNEGYNKVTGFDEAIVGVSSRSNLVYSIDKCIDILEANGFCREDAIEHFYNELDAMYVGVGSNIHSNIMTPIGKYIVIKTVEEEIKTSSGLLLSAEDANGFRYKQGIVVASGTDVNAIKADDKIYYDKSHSFTMIINEEPMTIIREADVVVVL